MNDVTRETLDRLARTATRRMYVRCRKCGTAPRALEVSHFIGRANISTRWNLTNLDLLCVGCHSQLQREGLEYKWLKCAWDGNAAVSRLCGLNSPAAYKPDYSALEFRLASHEALTEVLGKGIWAEELRFKVFREGLGVVSIPRLEVTL